MTEEEINELKKQIEDGKAMAHDPLCSQGFEASEKYIKFLEDTLKWCKNKIKSFYEDI